MDLFLRTARHSLIVVLLTLAHAPAVRSSPALDDPSETILQNQLTDISCRQDEASGDVLVSGKIANTDTAGGLTNVDLHIISDLVPFLVNSDGAWASNGKFSGRHMGDMEPGEVFEFLAVYRNVTAGDYGVEIAVTQTEHAAVQTECDVTVVEPAPPAADLHVAKFGPDEDELMVGDEFSYDIVFKNNGPAAAPALVVDELPDGLEYVRHVIPIEPDPCTFTDLQPPDKDRLSCELDLAPGQAYLITVTVRATKGGAYTNVATIDSDKVEDPEAFNNQDEVTVEVQPAADLYVAKSGPLATELNVGDEFGYTIVFGNNGPDAAGALIADELPEGVVYVAHEITKEGTQCNVSFSAVTNADRLECPVDLAPGEEHIIVITVRATEGGSFTNLATIASGVEDPNEENNSDEVTTEVMVPEPPEKSADLAIVKTAAATSGSEIVYTLTITNNGPDDANATIEDELPAGVEYTSHETSADAECVARDGANTVVCHYPGLAAGDSRTLTIRTTERASGSTTNMASVVSDVPDPVASNNEASAGLPELNISKIPSNTSPTIGSEITFTIRVENTGTAPATNLQILDEFSSENLQYISSSHPDCEGVHEEFDGEPVDSVECPMGNLGVGETVSVEITFLVVSVWNNEISNTAYAKADNEQVFDVLYLTPGDYLIDALFMHAGAYPTVGQKHATDDAFDVYIDIIKVVDNAAPGTTIRLNPLLTNISPTIHLVPSDSENLADAVFTDSVDFFTGDIAGDDFHLPDSYALIFVGPQDDLRLLLQRDARFESDDPAYADLLMIHAAPDVPPLRIRILDETDGHAPTETLAEMLAYAEMSGYHSLAAAAFNVEVADAGSGTQLEVFRLDLSEAAGKVVTLALSGDDSGQLALLAFDSEGNRQDGAVVTAAESNAPLPLEYALFSNYPNPFNPSTMIRYALPDQTAVELVVFDALGRTVQTLVKAEQKPGTYTVVWDGRDAAGRPAASGVYLYKITTGSFSDGRSMLLIK